MLKIAETTKIYLLLIGVRVLGAYRKEEDAYLQAEIFREKVRSKEVFQVIESVLI